MCIMHQIERTHILYIKQPHCEVQRVVLGEWFELISWWWWVDIEEKSFISVASLSRPVPALWHEAVPFVLAL
jgi:hypothetical protein